MESTLTEITDGKLINILAAINFFSLADEAREKVEIDIACCNNWK